MFTGSLGLLLAVLNEFLINWWQLLLIFLGTYGCAVILFVIFFRKKSRNRLWFICLLLSILFYTLLVGRNVLQFVKLINIAIHPITRYTHSLPRFPDVSGSYHVEFSLNKESLDQDFNSLIHKLEAHGCTLQDQDVLTQKPQDIRDGDRAIYRVTAIVGEKCELNSLWIEKDYYDNFKALLYSDSIT